MIRRAFHNHGLSIVTVGVFALWFVLYCFSDPNTHIGQFFGNAIADWSGSVVIILGTKFLLERARTRAARSHVSTAVSRAFVTRIRC
jgi:putative Mn2+ efflux pump MntP